MGKPQFYILLIILFIFLLFINFQIIYAQNITIGLGLGYCDVFIKNYFSSDILSSIPEPAPSYEVFSYLSMPILNNIDLIFGISAISKGFLYSLNKKYELFYLHFFLKTRFLFFRDINSKSFIEIGLNIAGQLLANFILDYSNFSITNNELENLNEKDNSFNFGTGIIIKNIIISFNIQVQLDTVFSVNKNYFDYDFSNYSMILSFGFII